MSDRLLPRNPLAGPRLCACPGSGTGGGCRRMTTSPRATLCVACQIGRCDRSIQRIGKGSTLCPARRHENPRQ